MVRLGRVVAGHPRTLGATALGIAVYILLPPLVSASTRWVLAWDAGAVVLLGLLAVLFASGHDDRAMADNAERQDEGEWTLFWITLAGAVASFVALTADLSSSKDLPPIPRNLHIALVGLTLLVSWLLTHIIFALRYAHEYYGRISGSQKVQGGLEFPGGEPPDYWDFVYFSVVVGMTFQVSDVQITSRKLRRLAVVHGLLSFLFNTVIVALTVNIAASLL